MDNMNPASDAGIALVAPQENFGSIEQAMAGQTPFSIRQIIAEAWEKVRGSKGTIWAAFLMYMLVALPVALIVSMVLGGVGASVGGVGGSVMGVLLSQVAILAIVMPMAAGLWMIGIKRAAKQPVDFTEIFKHYDRTLPVLGVMVLQYILVLIGFLLLIIPGIYLSIAYTMALPLVIEKKLSPWQALETSRKAIHHHWFRFLGLGIVMGVIYLVSALLTLGIALIWVLPFLMLCVGVCYRNLFGFDVEAASAAQ